MKTDERNVALTVKERKGLIALVCSKLCNSISTPINFLLFGSRWNLEDDPRIEIDREEQFSAYVHNRMYVLVMWIQHRTERKNLAEAKEHLHYFLHDMEHHFVDCYAGKRTRDAFRWIRKYIKVYPGVFKKDRTQKAYEMVARIYEALGMEFKVPKPRVPLAKLRASRYNVNSENRNSHPESSLPKGIQAILDIEKLRNKLCHLFWTLQGWMIADNEAILRRKLFLDELEERARAQHRESEVKDAFRFLRAFFEAYPKVSVTERQEAIDQVFVICKILGVKLNPDFRPRACQDPLEPVDQSVEDQIHAFFRRNLEASMYGKTMKSDSRKDRELAS